jgi:sugar lactone lactonase YvrE
MFISRYVAISAVSALLLSACSFSGQPTPATSVTNSARSAPMLADASKAAQHLYVGNASTITVYGLTSPSVVRTISKVSPTSIVFDKTGTMYVANSVGGTQGSVSIYAPQATKPALVITDDVHYPNSLVVNDKGRLFVSDYYSKDYAYAPGKTTPLYAISGLLFSVALALDDSGNLYVAQNQGPYGGGGGRVQVFAQSNGAFKYTIKGTIEEPEAIALDASGNLFVANDGFVTAYQKGTDTLMRTLKGGLKAPHAMAFDKSGQLYVADDAGNAVFVYSTKGTKPVLTITKGVKAPVALAFDAAGNLYVANATNVTEYAPGTASPVRTFSSGVTRPTTIAVGP